MADKEMDDLMQMGMTKRNKWVIWSNQEVLADAVQYLQSASFLMKSPTSTGISGITLKSLEQHYTTGSDKQPSTV